MDANIVGCDRTPFGALQKPGAGMVAVFNMGGSVDTNCCSILEARS